MLKYIELKSGYSDNGPAWIAEVSVSRTWKSIYFNGITLQREIGVQGNHFDAKTGEEYWISGLKKNQQDRHSAGSGKILIDEVHVKEYLSLIGASDLNRSVFEISKTIEER